MYRKGQKNTMDMLYNLKHCTPSLYFLVLLLQGTASLPDQCPCEIDMVTDTTDCFSKGLTSVPKCVPNNTRALLLGANKFTTLYREQFGRFVNLRNLSLFSNVITHIKNNSFMWLTKLRVLDLNNNSLHILNSSSFAGLSSLCILNLRNNSISVLNDYSFYDLSSLSELSLDSNALAYFYNHSFKGLSKLKYLNLNTNTLGIVESFPVNVFEPLTALEELHINKYCVFQTICKQIDRRLRQIPSLKKIYMDVLPHQILGDGFDSLKNLEELYFYGDHFICIFYQIDNKTFASLRNSQLTTLQLKNCEIRHIHKYSFDSLRHLTYLDMSGNSDLGERGFWNLTKSLQNTNIVHLNASDISNECVTLLSYGLVDTSLEILDLSKSAILFYDREFRLLPESLKHLFIQYNCIYSIEFEDIIFLENLVTLDLSHQSHACTCGKPGSAHSEANHSLGNGQAIRRHSDLMVNVSSDAKISNKAPKIGKDCKLDFQSADAANYCWSMPLSLESIDLSFSSFALNMPVVCDSNNSLRVLRVSNQDHVHSSQNFGRLWRTMAMLHSLEYFDASNNHIKNLPENLFSNQKHLRHLLLSRNSLVIVNFDIKIMKYLKVLDLADNSIQYISKQVTESIETIAKTSNLTVFLQNNDLSCNCDRQDFVTWLLKTKVVYQKQTLECLFQNGTQLSLSNIADIHERLVAECIAFPVIMCCSIGFPVLLLLLSLVAVAYYKRWRFRYLLSVGRRNISPYHPLEDRAIDMETDVYISYERDFSFTLEQSLHEFVTQVLYPALQNRGFKVLIRDELDSGRKLYDVISRAVRKSKTIIVLLSNDYCRDMWNVFEFNMAVMEGIYTKQEKIVPVMLEILSPELLQEEVYAFLISEHVPKYTSEISASNLIDYITERIVR